MFARTLGGATLAVALALPVPAFAEAAPVLHPERIGAETVRYYAGQPTVRLQTTAGIVEVRPLPVEKGRVAFAVAVVNTGPAPANFGTQNIAARVNGVPVAVPTPEELADAAEQKARGAKIGVGLLAGAVAAIASTASNQGSYYRHVRGPRGGYTRAVHWEDNTPGVVGATVAVAGGAAAIASIDRTLDTTLARMGGEALRTTTVDPGASFGGLVVVPVDRAAAPAQVRLEVSFGGAVHPFAFRLTPAGMAAPAPLPASR